MSNSTGSLCTKGIDLSLAQNFKMMAVYNQRMNTQLITVCEQLEPEQLQQETNSFFSTVMCYWNHILFGDLIMLSRLVANDIVNIEPHISQKIPAVKSVNDQFVNNLSELMTLRALVDEIYLKITQDLTVESYNGIIKYTTSSGEYLEKNIGEFFQHIFNHQTHHRGQLTCILSQFGLDFGCTDLPIIVSN